MFGRFIRPNTWIEVCRTALDKKNQRMRIALRRSAAGEKQKNE